MTKFRNDLPHAPADHASGDLGGEEARLIAANEVFYRAFRDMDMEAMEAVWSKAEDIAVIHPGWARLAGRDAVMDSWRNMFLNNGVPPYIQIVNPQAFVNPGAAFVLCYEDLGGTYLIATNIFVPEDGEWRLVHHQSGPTQAPVPAGRLN